jgi:hypothetical protein
VKYQFVKEKVENGDINFVYVSSAENLADILTKALACDAVLCCCDGIDIQGKLEGKDIKAGEVL